MFRAKAAAPRLDFHRKHRLDIDGLRTVAILGVLVFHLDHRWAPGGYLGVDVFFVISGYLITGNILRDIESGAWGFLRFYSRRALRLFPALFAAILLTLAAGAVVLTPQLLVELGHSAQASVFWYSNIFFWLQSGYFDTAAAFKPLLHTWSLSVEEQFYLVWPAFLLAAVTWGGRRWPFAAICLVLVASLVAAIGYGARDAAATFYLTPFRFFEFAIGALVVWRHRAVQPGPVAVELVLAAAIVAIGYSYATFRGAAHPVGVASLLPCLATAAFLAYGDRSVLLGRLLATPVPVWLGRISYSVYLVHWPLIVLVSFALVREPSLAAKLGLGAASILLGYALYAGVERPFLALRKAQEDRVNRFGLPAGLAVAAALFVLASPLVIRDGWTWRYPDDMQTLAEFNFNAKRAETWDRVNAIDWSSYDGEPFDVLVVGDSHGKDFFNALVLNRDLLEATYGPLDIRVYTTNLECEKDGERRGKVCSTEYPGLFELGLHRSAKTIVFSQSWAGGEIAALPGVIRKIRKEGTARVVVAENTVEFADVPSLLLRRYWAGDPATWIDAFRGRRTANRNKQLASVLKRLDPPVPVIAKSKAVCEGETCTVIDAGGAPYLYDHAHWTLEGARFFGRRLLEAGALDVLFARDPDTGGVSRPDRAARPRS